MVKISTSAPLLDWVKRLGQHHYVQWATNTTLCGMSCLGNNYVHTLPKDKWTMCPECERIAKNRGLI